MGWVGQTVPLEGTAVGAALDGRPQHGGCVVAHDTIEEHSERCSAPIRDAAASGVIGALSIVGPKFRLTDDVCAEHGAILVRHFRALSEGLGGVWAGTKPATYPNDWAAAEERIGLALA